jgi:hypothetical protein
MASKIKAVNAYRPKIALGATVQKEELLRYIAGRTGINEGTLDYALREVRDAIIFFGQSGRGVKIEGLGTYLPSVALDGAFDVDYRQAPDIKNGLNAPGAFTGQIENKENVGKTADDLVAQWDQDHPEDPVV